MFSFLKAPISSQKALDILPMEVQTFVLLQGNNSKRKSEIFTYIHKEAHERALAHTVFSQPKATDFPYALYLEEERLCLLDANAIELAKILPQMQNRNAVFLSIDYGGNSEVFSKLILALLSP